MVGARSQMVVTSGRALTGREHKEAEGAGNVVCFNLGGLLCKNSLSCILNMPSSLYF